MIALEALGALAGKLVDGRFIVESTNRKLAAFGFCKQGAQSELATARYREILKNIGKA